MVESGPVNILTQIRKFYLTMKHVFDFHTYVTRTIKHNLLFFLIKRYSILNSKAEFLIYTTNFYEQKKYTHIPNLGIVIKIHVRAHHPWHVPDLLGI